MRAASLPGSPFLTKNESSFTSKALLIESAVLVVIALNFNIPVIVLSDIPDSAASLVIFMLLEFKNSVNLGRAIYLAEL